MSHMRRPVLLSPRILPYSMQEFQQGTGVGSQRSEVGGQKSEVGGQRSEVRRKKGVAALTRQRPCWAVARPHVGHFTGPYIELAPP